MSDGAAAGICRLTPEQCNFSPVTSQYQSLLQQKLALPYQDQLTHYGQDLRHRMMMLVAQDFGDGQNNQLARDITDAAMQAQPVWLQVYAALSVHCVADDLYVAGRPVLVAGKEFCCSGGTEYQDVGGRAHKTGEKPQEIKQEDYIVSIPAFFACKTAQI